MGGMDDITTATTAALVAEYDRLVSLKVWGIPLIEVTAELHRRQPLELSHDAYYDGTAADRRTVRP